MQFIQTELTVDGRNLNIFDGIVRLLYKGKVDPRLVTKTAPNYLLQRYSFGSEPNIQDLISGAAHTERYPHPLLSIRYLFGIYRLETV